jgi:putative transposase
MIEHPEAERVDPIAGDVHAVRRDSRERYGARKIKCVLASWRPLCERCFSAV